jgi:hypothetical protein
MPAVMRLGRWAFNILAAGSLLLCLAIAVLWLRSSNHIDRIGYHHVRGEWADTEWPKWGVSQFEVGPPGLSSRMWYLQSDEGACLLFVMIRDYEAGDRVHSPTPPGWITWQGLDVGTLPYGWGGISYEFFSEAQDHSRGVTIIVPHWAIIVVTAVTPLLWLTRRLIRRRREPGLCPICSYDLRATPGRCPECGTLSKKREE